MSKIFGRIASPLVLACALVAAPAFSEEVRDANADANLDTVLSSSGVMIVVPVSKDGQEDTNAAEMRVVNTEGTEVAVEDLPTVWENATAVTELAGPPVVDTSTDADNKNWGWNRYGGYGWRAPYYYYSYYPYYNYYGSYYNYYGSYRPYYYNNYDPYGSYWGRRYYYYPRGW
jgi:hypothetical protein